MNLSAAPARCHLGLPTRGLPPWPAALDPILWLGVASAPNSDKRTDGMFWYLSHIANGIFQVEFMENIQNPIS